MLEAGPIITTIPTETTMIPSRTHYRTCNLCEAMCGLELEVSGAAVTKIRGDADDPFSRGYHCIKGEALADLHADPNRLKRPMRRTHSGWEEISWEVAFNEVTENIERLQKAHGRDALASYIGNPNAHNFGSILFLQGFLRQLRTRNNFAATSLDQLPHHMVAYFLFGHQLLLPIPDVDRTDFMIIMGANPQVSRGSLMTAPDISARLKAIRERGGKVFLIDPRRTETATVVDHHHFIRPGTDAVLLLAMLHVVFAERLENLRHLTAFTDGLDAVRQMALDFSPERAAPVTGIDAPSIRALAKNFASAKSAVCYGRFGVSTQEFGALCQWLITVLNCVTGNLDRPGGAMFTTPALDPLPSVTKGHYGRWKSRVRGLPEFAGELPMAVLTEEILTPGQGQIRGLVTCAGNPALSSPNGAELERALAGLDYMVSIDFYLNETTRFARHILPPTGPLEHENYDAVFHLLAIRNTAKFSPPCFTPESGTRHDWQILSTLQRRLAAKESVGGWIKGQLRRSLTPQRMLAMGLRYGPYGAGLNPFGSGLSLTKLKRATHGLDFGPLQSRLPSRLYTANKRIDLAPSVFLADVARLTERLFQPAVVESHFDLQLIGRRQVRMNNSWMGHLPRLTKGKGTCTALIHSTDAAARGIATGDMVRVSSRVGSLTIPATVVASIMPGVISIPHGFGHTRSGTQLTVPDHAKGVSVNDITDPSQVDILSGTAIFNGVPVRIEVVDR